MLAIAFKSCSALMSVSIPTCLAQVSGIQDAATLTTVGAGGLSMFFFQQWMAERTANKKAWEEVERIRADRDKARTQCINCPGNETRRAKENTHNN